MKKRTGDRVTHRRWRLQSVLLCGATSFLLLPIELPAAAPLDAEVAGGIFGAHVLAENVSAVRRQAATLDAEQRFELLAEWVLPDVRHSGFRLSGEFSQTRPAPVSDFATEHDGLGGALVSPMFDLLDLAAATGRIAELRDRVAAVEESPDSFQQRAREALLLLLSLELGDAAAAGSAFDALFAAVSKSEPQSLADQWPETLVAARCLKRFPDFAPLSDLLGYLMTQRVQKRVPAREDDWFVYLSSLAREYDAYAALRTGGPSGHQRRAVEPLRNWIPVSRELASSCGRGLSVASWQWDGVECRHLRGHTEDYLFYHSPLRGEYSIEADVLGYSTAQLLIAGELFGPGNPMQLITGLFRTGSTTQPIAPPLHQVDQWIRFRTDIKDGVNRVWVNGRLVHSRKVTPDFDPWVAIRSWSRAPGTVRDLRISGRPEIPNAVELSSPGGLAGWYPYYGEDFGTDSVDWQTPVDSRDGAQIVGVRRGIPGYSLERLLRYHRPLIEDGSIEYEFYYSPGESVVHPALGRLAFLLDPDGVRRHWLTDSRYDRSSLSPDNSTPFDAGDPGRQPLPLRADEWNSLRLALTGQTARLELNGEAILETPLDATNSRHFGLFHFAEQSEVRVRNVVLRGDWPKTLPDIADQQLADPAATMFDAQLAALDPVFEHDFRTEELPDEYFEFSGGFEMSQTALTPQGFEHFQKSDGEYRHSSLNNWLRMHGDFDVTVGFADLQLAEKQVCGAELWVTFDGGYAVAVKRRWQKPDCYRVVVDWALPPQAGTSTADAGEFRRVSDYISTEAATGRMRVARRGDTAYVLFAENDSSEFRVVASRSFESMRQRMAQARLTIVANEGGTTRVTWQKLRIGAEQLLILPDPRNPPKLLLNVINADGSGLKQITQPFEDPEIAGYASPDWSPDGQWIAFDGYTGRAETSHSYLIRADGTGFKDLGLGIMPTFSPDGKRIAFTWALNGMATMDLNGENREVVTPDGWGAQWSPNGKWIAYESRGRVNGSYSANVTIIDLKTKEKRMLLEGEQATRYSQIYWNAAWSPDSRQFAFKGNVKSGQTEVAITSVDGSSKVFRVVSEETFDPEMAWHPDGNSLLLAKVSKPHGGKRLFVYDLVASKLSLLESQPMDRMNFHGAWSPDGKRIVFTSRAEPGPIPWQPKQPAQ
ncbi:DUF1583 domain-containing protein [bacterium]|nr:DUF1583 domain-containing protein [bacterium]